MEPGVKAIGVALGGLATVLFVIAIISRLGSDSAVPGTVKSGFDAMTNIFKGVFS
jgi:hypothetical protein